MRLVDNYLMSPVTQYFQKRLVKRDWSMMTVSPSYGTGTCSWCIEPFVTCLLVPQKCFVSRPLTTGIHDGYALGNACNVSIDLGFNCIGSSKANAYIIHRPTGTNFPLALQVNTGIDSIGFAEVATADEIAYEGASGKPQFLWSHIDCPGQFGSGCDRLSQYQSANATQTRVTMICHLKDASQTHVIKQNWYMTLYRIQPSLAHWERVSMINADPLFALAQDKTEAWLDNIKPDGATVSTPA